MLPIFPCRILEENVGPSTQQLPLVAERGSRCAVNQAGTGKRGPERVSQGTARPRLQWRRLP
jgi:hypothetical protein